MSDLRPTAQRLFSLLDLTALDNQLTLQQLTELTEQSRTALGDVAALCIPPRFIPYARHYLEQSGISEMPIATVSNFPEGGDNLRIAYAETKAAVAYGADEVDVVLPYRSLIKGDIDLALTLVHGCRAICGDQVVMKVILETGELKTAELIRLACDVAISGGADFIKTSTGTRETGATITAARIMFEAIENADGLVGFKASGGIRSEEQAVSYLHLADEIMGQAWTRPANFRIGASQLHQLLVPNLHEEKGFLSH